MPRNRKSSNGGGSYGGQREPWTKIVDTPDMWAKLRSIAHGEDRPGHSPAFDATHQIGVGIFLGRPPTGGYGIRIPFMGRRDGKFVIEFEESTRAPGSITTQALISPWLTLLLERPQLPVLIEPRSGALPSP